MLKLKRFGENACLLYQEERHGFLFFVGFPECPGVDVAAPLIEVQVLADAHRESWCQSPHAGIANTDYDGQTS